MKPSGWQFAVDTSIPLERKARQAWADQQSAPARDRDTFGQPKPVEQVEDKEEV